MEDIDVNKILVSIKKFYSKKNKTYKYYISYDDNDEIKWILMLAHPLTNF